MKIHAVVGLGKSHIKTRDVSCYCEVCLTGQTCTSWNADRTREGEENDSCDLRGSLVHWGDN